ncbi:hypothetical protein F4809DRAFT_291981 [Biscogniauxia mediterranea]|nr:hypothetical protein F4809DRAFT_291981 [Biscogniauxia mediterranea]
MTGTTRSQPMSHFTAYKTSPTRSPSRSLQLFKASSSWIILQDNAAVTHSHSRHIHLRVGRYLRLPVMWEVGRSIYRSNVGESPSNQARSLQTTGSMAALKSHRVGCFEASLPGQSNTHARHSSSSSSSSISSISGGTCHGCGQTLHLRSIT